eukprot:758311-Hanusia_phi.AAC.1
MIHAGREKTVMGTSSHIFLVAMLTVRREVCGRSCGLRARVGRTCLCFPCLSSGGRRTRWS